jgi:hypothetical protein
MSGGCSFVYGFGVPVRAQRSNVVDDTHNAQLDSTVSGGKLSHVPLGVLDGAPSKAPDHHIQVASKAAWHQSTDDLPQFAEFPP